MEGKAPAGNKQGTNEMHSHEGEEGQQSLGAHMRKPEEGAWSPSHVPVRPLWNAMVPVALNRAAMPAAMSPKPWQATCSGEPTAKCRVWYHPSCTSR